MKKMKMACLILGWPWAVFAQHAFTGKITDPSGQPMFGATVWLSGASRGATSDANGRFVIDKLASGTYNLQVSFMGFQTYRQEVVIPFAGTLEIKMEELAILGDEVIVSATRANEKTPTTFVNFEREKITERNLGQDLPVLLNFTPSMVSTSDAGAGVGYTGMRIRGSDGTRINVTVNGIPINDAESHGTFWVNMPDLATSVENIQIQRGVGTSANGAASFGATVNLQTNGVSTEPDIQTSNGLGSFRTFRNNIAANSGLINGKFNVEGRLSRISSDGYIDRSASNLQSFYTAAGYYTSRTMLKFVSFGGREITQQAWYGTPEARIKNDTQGLQDVIDWSGEYNTPEQINNLLNSDRRFNYYLYDNEIDNYSQDHYQLHLSQLIGTQWNITGAIHYTRGKGYFEQFRNQDRLSAYNLPNVIQNEQEFDRSDIVRQRWLDNHFYGAILSAAYESTKTDLTIGGGINHYIGDHFGDVIRTDFPMAFPDLIRYYFGESDKLDAHAYLKVNHQLSNKLNVFADMQVRGIAYRAAGTDNDLSTYDVSGEFLFFNPKAGATYMLSPGNTLYTSLAVANREPVRDDFIDAPTGVVPQHETLYNLESGYRMRKDNIAMEVNYFLMYYQNQLVLTGALNDVGAAIRTNVPQSWRQGVEWSLRYRINKNWTWSPNLAVSDNRISNFTEVIYDYAFEPGEANFEILTTYRNTAISFSPAVIGASDLAWQNGPVTIQWLSKYVSRQYLDNTGRKTVSIDPYWVNDLRLSYAPGFLPVKQALLTLMINNVTNLMYSSNGYTWAYAFDGFLYRQNNFYPQAGIHFLLGLDVKF